MNTSVPPSQFQVSCRLSNSRPQLHGNSTCDCTSYTRHHHHHKYAHFLDHSTVAVICVPLYQTWCQVRSPLTWFPPAVEKKDTKTIRAFVTEKLSKSLHCCHGYLQLWLQRTPIVFTDPDLRWCSSIETIAVAPSPYPEPLLCPLGARTAKFYPARTLFSRGKSFPTESSL